MDSELIIDEDTMKSRGFTLIELLVVIAITGILAAVLTVFLRPAIDSYLDTRRRAQMSDMADTALRRIAQDVRSAVPNSLRVQGSSCFQVVPTIGGGRYRMAMDTRFASGGSSAWLDLTEPIPSGATFMAFDVFNQLRTLPAENDWVVINNQNTNDVYTGANRAQILGIDTPAPLPGAETVGMHRIYIAPQAFSSGYDGGRFVIVPNASQTVIYSCNGDTLYRTVANFTNALDANTCTNAMQAVVATGVESCTFVYDPNQGATQQSGFLQMWLTLANAQNDDRVTLVQGVHVENVP